MNATAAIMRGRIIESRSPLSLRAVDQGRAVQRQLDAGDSGGDLLVKVSASVFSCETSAPTTPSFATWHRGR